MPPLSVRGYLSALPAAMRKEMEDHTYRVYVTEALKSIAENTARAVISDGKSLTKSWYEIIDIDRPEEPAKTGDEIALDIMTRAGLHQKGGE